MNQADHATAALKGNADSPDNSPRAPRGASKTTVAKAGRAQANFTPGRETSDFSATGRRHSSTPIRK
jgi:hypothetical protein